MLNNPKEDDVLVVGTRWYEEDLIAWVLENEPHYNLISRACREDKDGKPSAQGEITYPERFDDDVLRELEAGLGPYLFSCLYLNMPVRSDDMLFKPGWIKYYETPPQNLAVYTTVDIATDPELAVTKDIDYSVVMTCGKDMRTGYIYVLEYTRMRANPGEFIRELFRHVMSYKPIVVGYENIAYQRSIDYWVKELMRQENLYFLLEPVPGISARNKPTRIAGLQPVFAAGSILLRSHMKDLEAELMSFPLGRHDDVVDALSMQQHFWRRTSGPSLYVPDSTYDPMSLDHAKEEILARRKKLAGSSPVFDPMRTDSSAVYPIQDYLQFTGRRAYG